MNRAALSRSLEVRTRCWPPTASGVVVPLASRVRPASVVINNSTSCSRISALFRGSMCVRPPSLVAAGPDDLDGAAQETPSVGAVLEDPRSVSGAALLDHRHP